MLTTGFALAVLTSAGFYFIYTKLPGWAKKWVVKHALITDVVACVFTYLLFGGTIVSLFAAAFVGIIVSLMLAILGNEVTAAALERFVERLKELRNKFVAYLEQQLQKETQNA